MGSRKPEKVYSRYQDGLCWYQEGERARRPHRIHENVRLRPSLFCFTPWCQAPSGMRPRDMCKAFACRICHLPQVEFSFSSLDCRLAGGDMRYVMATCYP